ncbi:MAG: PilZ domain-containing protein [Thiotrichales bacterium]|nr:PilZ domain-containing protein [Thiotrichales bacterium]
MIQLALEQRQSLRFPRPFLVTDYEDIHFQLPFNGHDVNLTGLSFWVDEADLFMPKQQLSLRLKNISNNETYCLDGVEVVHQREENGKILCGCHITQVTSAQLLAHHRIVMSDQQTASQSMLNSEMAEFDFVEAGSPVSNDQADFQEASLALNMAVSEMKFGRSHLNQTFVDLKSLVAQIADDSLKERFDQQLDTLRLEQASIVDSSLALTMLAKLLAHTPNDVEQRQAWRTMIADFENRFLTEQHRVVYDFMHQGLSVEEANQQAFEMTFKDGSGR